MRVEQGLTGTFSSNATAWDTEDFAYYNLTNPNSALEGISSVDMTYATIQAFAGTSGAGVSSWAYLLFNSVSSIPYNAIIDSVTCDVRCRTYTTSYISGTVQLYSGNTGKGSLYTLPNSAGTVTVSGGTWTREELNNLRLKFTATRTTSSTSTSYGIRVYGASLNISYHYDQHYYTVNINNYSSIEAFPRGTTEYLDNGAEKSIVYTFDDRIKLIDNNIDVTDLIKSDSIYLGKDIISYDNTESNYEIDPYDSLGDFDSLIGSGVDSETYVSIDNYSNHNSDSYLYFFFKDLSYFPDNLDVSSVKVYIKYNNPYSSEDNDFPSICLFDLNNNRISYANYVYLNSTSSNPVYALTELSSTNLGYYNKFKLGLNCAYRSNPVRIYGATAYLTISNAFVYKIPLIEDHTILVKSYIYYLKVAGAWADIKNIWVKNNGIWTVDKSYELNNNTRYIKQNAFTQVEYLESTGTQYIDLNIIPNSETGIYLKSTCSNNTDTYIVGLRDTNGDTRWCIGYSSLGYYYGYGTYVAMSDRITNFTAESNLNWLNNKKFTSSDGTNISEANLSTLPFTPSNKIRIFGSSGVAASYAAWLGKIYNVKVSQGSNIVMDLIPVRIGQTGYMYDTINNAFYGNMGTGNFVIGSDIQYTPVDYLESSGTQYIELPCSADAGDYFSISGYMTPLHTTTGSGLFSIFSADIPAQFSSNFYSYNNETEVIVYDSSVGSVSGSGGWTGVEYEKTYFKVSTTGRTFIGEFNELSRPLTASFTKLKIFGGYYQGGYPVRFHSIIIKKNNDILYDLVPVKVGQVGYMYDKVSKQLFGNHGTGSFIVGEKMYDSKVEYIKSTGSQYIDTGYIPTLNTHVSMKVAYKGTGYSDALSGSMYSTSARFHWGLWTYISGTLTVTHFEFACGLAYCPVREEFDNNIHILELWGNGQFGIDGRTGYIGSDENDTTDNIHQLGAGKSIVLFARNNSDSVGKPISNMELYSFKIYESNILVNYFIPVRIGKIGYLYDSINNQLYSKSGTEDFVLGNDIDTNMIKIEYLESDGNQYIDTGIIPDADTGIYLNSTCASNADLYIVGLREDNGNTRWSIGRDSNGYYYGYGTWEHTNPSITSLTAESYMNWLNDKKFTVTDGDNTQYIDLPTLSFMPTLTIRVFGSTRGYVSNVDTWAGKIYGIKISQGSNIVMDLIPVRIGQVGYLYDKVSNKLFGNNGTGSFILGDDII